MNRILVVDDKEEARYLLHALLQGFGYEVDTAVHGAEALNRARQTPPDLIIADILMPVMDGFTLCREWKKDESLRAIPFIFYTATYTDPLDRDFALSLGADQFIVKPEEPVALIEIIRDTLQQANGRSAFKTEPEADHTPLLHVEGTGEDDVIYLKLYNEALVRKLESKIEQLESSQAVRKRAEAERVRLVTAIEQVAEGIIITDEKWTVLYVNPGFECIVGYDKSEIIGRDCRILGVDYAGTLGNNISDTINRGQVWSGRMLNRKKDGTLFHAEVTISPVRDTWGNIINYVSVYRDVTREVNLEKNLRQAQKMECMGTLAGGIAHDFNNILTAVIGYSEIALSLAPEESPLKRSLDRVLEAGLRARDLVRQILTFSRKSEQEKKPVQLSLIIKEVMKLLRASLPSTIEIFLEIDEDVVETIILSDSTQIHQVLMNLCTNAAYAMQAKGGILKIRLKNVEADSHALSAHSDLLKKPYVCLEVSDTGHGMDAETMERIFDPYFTTKEVGEGTGLGLSVAVGIIRSSGGTIEVESKPDHGTTFYVFFPKLEEKIVQTVKISEALPSGNERILFVDDEKALSELGKEMLEKLGYKVTSKLSSLEAFETFRADPCGFDLLITDVTMPHLSGRELAKMVTNIRPNMPVILCTGLGDVAVEKDAANEVGPQVIVKPYSIATLATGVRRALEQLRRPESAVH